MQLLLRSVVLGLFWLVGSAGWADCACFCVDGNLQTMCSTVAEAQENSAVCPVVESTACPTSTEAATDWSYEATDEGAVNCRDVRVWDADERTFHEVKACDVLSADSQ